MSDQTTKQTTLKEDIVTELDQIINKIELIETNSKVGAKNPTHKYIRITLDSGKTLRWYPYNPNDRTTIQTLLTELDESDK